MLYSWQTFWLSWAEKPEKLSLQVLFSSAREVTFVQSHTLHICGDTPSQEEDSFSF